MYQETPRRVVWTLGGGFLDTPHNHLAPLNGSPGVQPLSTDGLGMVPHLFQRVTLPKTNTLHSTQNHPTTVVNGS